MTSATSRPAEIDFIRELRQTRTFTDQPVPDSILRDLLEIARWSGSSKNTQPWNFVVVRDPERIATISEFGAYSKFLKGAPLVIVIVLDGAAPRSEAYDEGRVSERLMLAAKAYGLGSGTGWWGTEEGAAQVKQVLGIPADKTVISGVAIGYPAPRETRAGAAAGRKPLAGIVHYETYGNREA